MPKHAPVAALGPAIEHHPLFPERTNVEFVERAGARPLAHAGVGTRRGHHAGLRHRRLRHLAAAHRRGLVGARCEIVLDGGTLQFDWDGDGASILMTGPAALELYAARSIWPRWRRGR